VTYIILYELHRILGTPTEKTWPGISQLPDYKPNFPRWSGEGLRKAVPQLDNNGLDLLEVHSPVNVIYGKQVCDRCLSFSFPEAALLLVSTKTIKISGLVQHRKSTIDGLPVTLNIVRVKSDKSDWLRIQNDFVWAC